MTPFAEITRQVHLMNDHILSDMICGNIHKSDEDVEFSKHILATKYWFIRISSANKKRFLLFLVKDVRCIWTISLLLKSIWNCRPKDAVMSVSESRIFSSYDQAPMDHDRTAVPLYALVEVMMSDRKWFQSLESERQALVLSELLSVSGGPIMWEILKVAEQIYNKYLEQQMTDLQECVVVNEAPVEKKPLVTETPQVKRDPTAHRKSSAHGPESDSGKHQPLPGQAQKELDANLALWASTVKAMKDSMKLEELEMRYRDGTMKKIWKVNRPKPEIVETVDFIQLLPSSISKRILIFLPLPQLVECARVNKYWAYLIDEIRAEMVARQKIDIELEKLRDNVLRHDINLDLLSKSESQNYTDWTSIRTVKTRDRVSFFTSNKSCPISLRTMMNKQAKKSKVATKPIRNMNDLKERLERRGAADENIWKWCKNILKITKCDGQMEGDRGGVLTLENTTFPCPLFSNSVKIPLVEPLLVDPTRNVPVKQPINVKHSDVDNVADRSYNKRYTLWSTDFSSLYPVCKISSHLSPF